MLADILTKTYSAGVGHIHARGPRHEIAEPDSW